MNEKKDVTKREETRGRFCMLLELFAVFFKIGAVTFGGGLAMLPILESELTEKRNWVTKETLLDYFAIGQMTPGIIAVNVATFIGYTHAGILGGCIATLGVVAPSLVIISVIASFLESFAQIVWVQKALMGINIAVAALLCKVVVTFIKKILDWRKLLLFAAAFTAIVVFHAPTVLVVVSSLVLGLVVYAFQLKRRPPSGSGDGSLAQDLQEPGDGSPVVSACSEGGSK